jgi:hypothetical protein
MIPVDYSLWIIMIHVNVAGTAVLQYKQIKQNDQKNNSNNQPYAENSVVGPPRFLFRFQFTKTV